MHDQAQRQSPESRSLPADIAAWRKRTRPRLIEQRLGIPPEEHRRASLAVEKHLEEILDPLPPQTISAYWPFKAEVDLRDLMERLRRKGWITALPSVVRPRAPLEFLPWTPEAEMDSGVYGIPVPRTGERVRPDVIVTPLVAFDARNYRLGYGAGYFDITLAGLQPRPRSIGVGFELGRLETIYPLHTDIPLDFVVTESGVQRSR
jgi:5-formyltetrahydrofolate cyclo-ligase